MPEVDINLTSRPATSPPPRDQTNEKPPNIVVPIPPSVEPNDPLDPKRLAIEELTIRQLLQQADRVIATVRVNYYNEYRRLTGQIGSYLVTYRNYSAWGEHNFKRAELYMKELVAIKLEGIEGLNLRDEARKALGDRWYLWWFVYNTFKSLAKRYTILAQSKEDLIGGVTRPPSDPPELV